MPRLFLAIDIPAPVKAALGKLAPELPVARWIATDQIHLTLRFVGEVDEERAKAIKRSLFGVAFAEFALSMRGVGHFPPAGRPRVLWVGTEPCNPLLRLQQAIELALMDAGIPADERGFSPHLTLARLKETPPAAVHKFELRHADVCFPPFQVGEFILYSSVLGRQGALHNKEAVYPCLTAAGSS
jgi:2'-5' RNA ligase